MNASNGYDTIIDGPIARYWDEIIYGQIARYMMGLGQRTTTGQICELETNFVDNMNDSNEI